MKNDLGYGKKCIEGKMRFYKVKRKGHPIRLKRIKESIYNSLVADDIHINMQSAVNEYYDFAKMEHIRRQRDKDLNKNNKAIVDDEVIHLDVKTSLLEKLWKWILGRLNRIVKRKAIKNA